LAINAATTFGTNATRRSPSFDSRTTPTVGRAVDALCDVLK
jgi:hypothetical protein